jgi:hypothetical protein
MHYLDFIINYYIYLFIYMIYLNVVNNKMERTWTKATVA